MRKGEGYEQESVRHHRLYGKRPGEKFFKRPVRQIQGISQDDLSGCRHYFRIFKSKEIGGNSVRGWSFDTNWRKTNAAGGTGKFVFSGIYFI